MQRNLKGALAYYTFDSFADSGTLVHAISTRHGGVSPAPFDALNLGRKSGDTLANVEINFQRLHDALALDSTATVRASQAQADRVAIVNAAHRGTVVDDVDALVTNVSGVPLFLHYADCVPILFFDPAHRAIGIAHAGWRGTVGKIATKTAQAMRDTFGTQPHDLIAGIAPSIGPCCYRVGADVSNQIRAAFDNADELLIPQADGGVHLDLWQANVSQLGALGVKQIEVASLCTAHRTDDFYSWRAEQAKTGRFGAIIALRA